LSGQYEVNWDDFNALVAQDPRVAMFAPVLPALQPLMVLSVQSLLAPFRNVQVNHHFVHVTWTERGEEQSEIFRLSERDADSLLDALGRSTGKRVSQLRVMEELNKGNGTIHYFKISTELAIGRRILIPGTYPVLLVPSSADEGVLYVLVRGSLTEDDIISFVPVKISPFVEGQSPSARCIRDASDTLRLAESRVGPHLLRLERPGEE
ncbi:MAG TPA: hypothetical protein VGQ11_13045, partial [Candidatus Acidoferrales bacterium]|nr:hypothetical protein [Candidatus Acidoferrales bacterium]